MELLEKENQVLNKKLTFSRPIYHPANSPVRDGNPVLDLVKIVRYFRNSGWN